MFWKNLKAKTHNLKWYLFWWNFKVLELLLCTFIFFLKQKSFSFVNLSLFLHDVLILWLESHTSVLHLYILHKLERSWRCKYFGAKLACIAWISLKTYFWCMKIHFQFHFQLFWFDCAIRIWREKCKCLQNKFHNSFKSSCFGKDQYCK